MKKYSGRIKRHFSIRKYVRGTTKRPRLAVFRSGKHVYGQVIDDSLGKTLAFASDLKITKKSAKQDLAFEVGKSLAEKAVKKCISEVVFDRGGFLYHGRIKKLAEGAREGGLKF
ncbi:50S ribosomal protein L18 [Candidatus Daviesbacteria bacterium]|nr:50S ribosomal protein L18 [Candidatus Daviesbacteria bacterium]